MSNEARQEILSSIRTHLAASAPFDAHEYPVAHAEVQPAQPLVSNVVELFRQNLEAVDGHCIIAHSKGEIAGALTQIISALQKTKLGAQRIAISDAPELERLMHMTDLEIEELGIAPNASDIFNFDVGITTAQAAIAETGTLALDSTRERHRLVSLVPPVHIAIVDAATIYATLGETLSMLQNGKELSPAITFITGPSRTADIELTLTIGVHGPQEIYVIINQPS
ncbi:MAG TPA: lactate utilization protein [Pyrinomonadaceae bacterium]